MTSMPLASAIALMMPLTLLCQDSSQMHFIRAVGEATVRTQPDRAELSIGVVTQAPTAEAASAGNATQAQSVLASLRRIVSGHGEIRTGGYAINPQYEYTNGQPPRLTGYEASNTVLVTLDEIGLAGKVIDEATRSGANHVSNVEFTVRDPAPLSAQALAQAAREARSNAESIAKALGVNLGPLMQAEPEEPRVISPRPLPQSFAGVRMSAPETPLESGTVEVHASVTVSFEVR